MGKPLSKEHRRKISEANLRRKNQPREEGELAYLRQPVSSAKALKERCAMLERKILEKDMQIGELTDEVAAMKRYSAILARRIEDMAAGFEREAERSSRKSSVHVNWGREGGAPSSR